ncbi:MAG: Nif3-like dinuclear metal center hexameric protein [Defluviitaleaceae bacterium]|nr:Nif3-like dinuclear metal center hexameric protein [Defluviitaleaceae bacterium]
MGDVVRVRDIAAALEELAPSVLKEEWDNVGLLVGDHDAEVRKVLVALDAVDGVVDEALSVGADMIVVHHPIIFAPMKSVTTASALGRRVIKLLRHDISVYAAHTNLDSARGGTNDILFEMLGLRERKALMGCEGAEIVGMGRVGNLSEAMSLADFAEFLRERLGAPYISYGGCGSREVTRVGLCAGSACESAFLRAARAKGCDVYVTGDVKYHKAQEAEELGLSLVDATHYFSEAIVVPMLREYIGRKFGRIDAVASRFDGQVMKVLPK